MFKLNYALTAHNLRSSLDIELNKDRWASSRQKVQDIWEPSNRNPLITNAACRLSNRLHQFNHLGGVLPIQIFVSDLKKKFRKNGYEFVMITASGVLVYFPNPISMYESTHMKYLATQLEDGTFEISIK